MCIVLKLLFKDLVRGSKGIWEAPVRCLPIRGLVRFQEVVSNPKIKYLGFPGCPHGDFKP